MSKLKSVIGVILVCCVLFPTNVFGSGKIEYNHNAIEILNGFYVNNLSEESHKAEQEVKTAIKNSKDVNFQYSSINLVSNAINIIGQLIIQDDELPFNIEGELNKIDTTNDIIVGNLEDKNNVFEVIHFSMNNSSEKFLSASGFFYNEPTINLYLQKKGTRDFIFIEMSLPNEINVENVFGIVNEFDLFGAIDLAWYQKVIKPYHVNQSDININEMVLTEASPLAPEQNQVYQQRQYIIKYYWMGRELEDLVWVNHTLYTPSTVEDFRVSAVIEKFYSYTWDYTNNQVVTYETATEIKNKNVKIGFVNGLAYFLFVGGKYTQGNSNIQTDVSYSLEIPYTGIDLNFIFTLMQSTVLYPVSLGGKPIVESTITDGKYLLANGDHMLVRVEYEGSNTTIYARFEYDVYNIFNSQKGDVQLQNIAP